MWTRLSLKTKLTVLVVLTVSVASFAFMRFAMQGLADLMERAAGLGAATAAEGLIIIVNKPWLRTVQTASPLDSEGEWLEAQFADLLVQGNIRRVELIRVVGGHTIEHVLSVPNDGSEDYRPSGKQVRMPPGYPMMKPVAGYFGVELAAPGSYIAGWAPIIHDNEHLGALMVIADSNEIQVAINTIANVLMLVMLVLILLSGLTAYKFAATFEKAAVTDGLMGIYNHKFFKQRLEEEVAKARRYKQQTALVLLDIDFFKRVNDTYGHATGDLVLKQLARWVLDSSRTTDVVARYGGEEVAVLLPHTGVAGAQEFAERLRLKISHQVIRDPEEDAEFRITVSIGVAQWEQGMGPVDMIKRADTALYQSKNAGRNRVTIYQDEILPHPPETSAQTGT